MARNIRAVLSPLLIINYVCGLRVVEFPAGHPKKWLSCLYHLLLWSTYCFLMTDIMSSYVPYEWIHYRVFIALQTLMAFISLFTRLYHDKKFRNCLRKLTIVDETLDKLGTTTDFQKLDTKMTRFLAGWFTTVLILNCGDSFWWQDRYNVLTSYYITFVVNYATHTNFLDDLIFAYILGYIGVKFDQVNEHLRRLADGEFTDRERRIKRAWENTVVRSQRRRFPNAPSSEFIMWTVTHLHLELCKISQEMNSIFGIQITVKSASYFCFIAENFWELFGMMFHNFPSSKKWFYIMMVIFWVLMYLCRFLLINYSCEIVSNKANATRDFINKVIYSTHNAEVRENIVQLLLQIIRAPLKFCGFGFFQFGFKFFCSYCTSIVTLLIIIIQANQDANKILKNYI